MEVHPDPAKALSDGANSLALASVPAALTQIKRVHEARSTCGEAVQAGNCTGGRAE
jgi:3-deoxy-D-manno-octulosonic acid (KDO) 8-phosphate synthase